MQTQPSFIDADTQIRFEEIRNGENPDKVLFAFHGYGSSANNFLPLISELSHPNTLYIIPDGLQECEGNQGLNTPAGEGRQWFSVEHLATNILAPKVASTAKIVNHFVDNQLKRLGIPHSKAVIFGFSQGAILASSMCTTCFPQLGGVIACSGCVLPINGEDIIAKPRCTLIHGKDDTVLPCNMSETGLKELKQAGIPAEGHFIEDLGHFIDQRAYEIINQKLREYWKL